MNNEMNPESKVSVTQIQTNRKISKMALNIFHLVKCMFYCFDFGEMNLTPPINGCNTSGIIIDPSSC